MDQPGGDPECLPPDRDVALDLAPHFSPPRRSVNARLLSIVIPLFNEEANVLTLWERLRAVLESLGSPFELLFVEDGSRVRPTSWENCDDLLGRPIGEQMVLTKPTL
jgi:Glycosyl transferase family 2